MTSENTLYFVPDSVKQKRRWVTDYVSTLDPETEYEKIMSIIAMYQQDEASMQLFIASSAVHVLMPAYGAEPVLFTNNYIRRPNQRNQNTLTFFWTWFGKGPSSAEGIEATKRLNHLHQRIAKHLPGHFEFDSDYIYTLACFTTIQNRLLKRLGLPELDPVIKKATYKFFAEICKHIRKGSDTPVEGYPDSFEACEEYCEKWERWDHRMSVPQQDLIKAFMDQWVAASFPPALEFIGNWIIYFTIPDHILKHYRLKPTKGFGRFFARNILKLAFIFKSKFAKDQKIPFIERRKQLSKAVLNKLDAKSRERADKAGWTKGGHEAVYVTKGGHSISACPVMHGNFDKQRLPPELLAKLEKVTENGRVEYEEFAENDEFKPVV
ncbi:MAG: DUF2236 domain-containing protein [Cellvibrionaceae bacterium]|nr:DUF2236 domain-containing protein [Cellvibrionaceae bacterium]